MDVLLEAKSTELLLENMVKASIGVLDSKSNDVLLIIRVDTVKGAK
jgi:hypothetical protein